MSLNNLAKILYYKREYAEAERLQREALAMFRRTLGEEHPDVAKSLRHLGQIAHAGGNLEGAEKLHREALAIFRKTLGEKHHDVTSCLDELLKVLLAKKDYAAAEPVSLEILGHGRSHGRLAVLGMCLLKQAKHSEAEPILRECLAIRQREMPDDWTRHNAMSLLGEALSGQGRHAEAEPLLVEGYEKMAPPDRFAFRKREALERIVNLYEAWGKPEKAAAWRALQESAPTK